MSETKELTLETLQHAVSKTAAAFRCVTEYQPAGGPGDKVFPPTYEGGRYATEDRWIDGEKVPCVLLDSVQSQANRMELALLDAVEDGQLDLPRLVVEFSAPGLLKPLRVTSLEAPHRAADAIFRDSAINGTKFRDTDLGKALDESDIRNAAPLFGLCPTALIFGLWDSTGPRGGLGAKFQRAIVSEMVGLHAVPGVKTASRIDPLQVMLGAGPVVKQGDGSWNLDSSWPDKDYEKKVKADQRPSVVNHGNVTPSIAPGGFTISSARQTTVLSLTALRRLRFPPNGKGKSDPAVNQAARVALAAIGLAGASLARAQGADLRSRCQLFPTGAFVWELLDDPTAEPQRFSLSPKTAVALAADAIGEAKKANLPWKGEVELKPSGNLLELLRRSQQLAATSGEGG
ncbi:MAG: type I-U CRISPR-associated protein Cas7 [Proteobacteria bacterium]|nr:type I-U CRISPR-associated protein Cas7 [Pseudomonadota bacterium]